MADSFRDMLISDKPFSSEEWDQVINKEHIDWSSICLVSNAENFDYLYKTYPKCIMKYDETHHIHLITKILRNYEVNKDLGAMQKISMSIFKNDKKIRDIKLLKSDMKSDARKNMSWPIVFAHMWMIYGD